MILSKSKKEFPVTKESPGPWRNTAQERAEREADRAPPHTSSQNETQEVIIILLQLAKSERKCLFKRTQSFQEHLCKHVSTPVIGKSADT